MLYLEFEFQIFHDVVHGDIGQIIRLNNGDAFADGGGAQRVGGGRKQGNQRASGKRDKM